MIDQNILYKILKNLKRKKIQAKFLTTEKEKIKVIAVMHWCSILRVPFHLVCLKLTILLQLSEICWQLQTCCCFWIHCCLFCYFEWQLRIFTNWFLFFFKGCLPKPWTTRQCMWYGGGNEEEAAQQMSQGQKSCLYKAFYSGKQAFVQPIRICKQNID